MLKCFHSINYGLLQPLLKFQCEVPLEQIKLEYQQFQQGMTGNTLPALCKMFNEMIQKQDSETLQLIHAEEKQKTNWGPLQGVIRLL